MNESRQTVKTDTLWLSNISALNFRKPGHLRKYCNNENFPIYGIISTQTHYNAIFWYIYDIFFIELTMHGYMHGCGCSIYLCLGGTQSCVNMCPLDESTLTESTPSQDTVKWRQWS